MKILANIAAIASSVCMLVSGVKVNAYGLITEVYLGTNQPPDELFNAGISPAGDNDNLQQTADGRSCIDGGDSRFVVATANRSIAQTEARRFSAQDPTTPYYIYTISAMDAGRYASNVPDAVPSRNRPDQWFDLSDSLRATYGAQDVYQLAETHRVRGSYIYDGSVPMQRIYSARLVLDGQISTHTEFNPAYEEGLYVDRGGEVYSPANIDYDHSVFVNYVTAINDSVLACAAANYCMPGRSSYLFSPSISQQTESFVTRVCPNLKFKKKPVREFYAGQILPILLVGDE